MSDAPDSLTPRDPRRMDDRADARAGMGASEGGMRMARTPVAAGRQAEIVQPGAGPIERRRDIWEEPE